MRISRSAALMIRGGIDTGRRYAASEVKWFETPYIPRWRRKHVGNLGYEAARRTFNKARGVVEGEPGSAFMQPGGSEVKRALREHPAFQQEIERLRKIRNK